MNENSGGKMLKWFEIGANIKKGNSLDSSADRNNICKGHTDTLFTVETYTKSD